MPISKETATDIALTYREIAAAEVLLDDVNKALDRTHPSDVRDIFGRRVDGLQLGVPNSDTSRTCFTVAWPLARPVLEAHIAAKRAELSALNEKARQELYSQTVEEN